MFQVTLSLLLLLMYAHFAIHNSFSALYDGLTGGIEIFSLGLICLVFFPPRFYQKLVSGSGSGGGESSVGER
jgi:hypothetical protein